MDAIRRRAYCSMLCWPALPPRVLFSTCIGRILKFLVFTGLRLLIVYVDMTGGAAIAFQYLKRVEHERCTSIKRVVWGFSGQGYRRSRSGDALYAV